MYNPIVIAMEDPHWHTKLGQPSCMLWAVELAQGAATNRSQCRNTLRVCPTYLPCRGSAHAHPAHIDTVEIKRKLEGKLINLGPYLRKLGTKATMSVSHQGREHSA